MREPAEQINVMRRLDREHLPPRGVEQARLRQLCPDEGQVAPDPARLVETYCMDSVLGAFDRLVQQVEPPGERRAHHAQVKELRQPEAKECQKCLPIYLIGPEDHGCEPVPYPFDAADCVVAEFAGK
ncbi:hypothetical protein NtRootA4_39250 [Arthrobacter sp. NtRootA4]|nr:hypothetical protein NtRootA2_00380 [Arthrobacter sp. NtRootA2]BCW16946.1 hypothetical protein NtRootA4_39250 [Arthrobacter sp. NtRootA4]BCW21171.1 hypothetical protein NtRootC7_00380 [Arthrobacter sp. NtRootC7]BCW25438.1 hypothetical protein NtRootC45_00380 [Arthrobacter sp. NtRootC45]BCW29707.1 hypothetical protein NtRootD5_00380 [Arthrobacter sp. NtRootD5]